LPSITGVQHAIPPSHTSGHSGDWTFKGG
jgi:hypothetical protein